MPIPYGKPLIAMLSALEELGRPATAAQIRERVPAALQAKTTHACHWGVVYGLMNEECSQRPRLYSLAPGWRERVEARQALQASDPPDPPPDEAHSREPVTVARALANRSPLEQAWAGFR